MKNMNKFLIKVLDDFRKIGIYEDVDIAKKIGISYATWKNLKQKKVISTKTLLKISNITGVSMLEYYELMNEENEK